MPVQIKDGIRSSTPAIAAPATVGRVSETPPTEKTLTHLQKDNISEFDKGEPEHNPISQSLL